MSFPVKGILDGSERIALYDEVGGNLHVTTQDIADLFGGGGANGLFDVANEAGAFLVTNATTVAAGLFIETTTGNFGFSNGMTFDNAPTLSGIFAGQNHTLDLADKSVILGGRTGIIVECINSAILGGIDNELNGTGSEVNTVIIGGTTIVPGTVKSNMVYVPALSLWSTPATGNETHVLVRDASDDGRVEIMPLISADANNAIGPGSDGGVFTPDIAAANLGFVDQVITAAEARTITGGAGASLAINTLDSFSVNTPVTSIIGSTTATLSQSVNSIITINAASIKQNNNLGSYVYGDGAGLNRPPSSIVDTYLTIDANGNVGRRSIILGSGPTWASTNLPLTGNRTHTGGGFSMALTGLSTYQVEAGATINLTSVIAQLIEPTAGVYHLGIAATPASLLPTDPGSTEFVKYNTTTGQLYSEDTVLAADGNGMFDVANDTDPWTVVTWTMAAASVATLTDTFDVVSAPLTTQFGATGLILTDAAGTLTESIDIQSTSGDAGMRLGDAADGAGWLIRTDTTHTLLGFQEITTGTPGNIVLQLHKTAPSLSLDVLATGQLGLAKYAAAATPPTGTATDLLAVDVNGDVIAEPIAGYLNPTVVVEWRQRLKDTQGITSSAEILDLDAGTGAGTVFLDENTTDTGIDVDSASFAHISVSLVIQELTVSGAGSIALFDSVGTTVLAEINFSTKGANGFQIVAFTHMAALAGTEKLTILVTGMDGVTITDAVLNVRN